MQAHHHALLLPDWGAVTLLLNGAHEPDAEQAAALQGRGVAVVAGALREVADSTHRQRHMACSPLAMAGAAVHQSLVFRG